MQERIVNCLSLITNQKIPMILFPENSGCWGKKAMRCKSSWFWFKILLYLLSASSEQRAKQGVENIQRENKRPLSSMGYIPLALVGGVGICGGGKYNTRFSLSTAKVRTSRGNWCVFYALLYIWSTSECACLDLPCLQINPWKVFMWRWGLKLFAVSPKYRWGLWNEPDCPEGSCAKARNSLKCWSVWVRGCSNTNNKTEMRPGRKLRQVALGKNISGKAVPRLGRYPEIAIELNWIQRWLLEVAGQVAERWRSSWPGLFSRSLSTWGDSVSVSVPITGLLLCITLPFLGWGALRQVSSGFFSVPSIMQPGT